MTNRPAVTVQPLLALVPYLISISRFSAYLLPRRRALQLVMPGLVMDVTSGVTMVPPEPRHEGTATLKMPDGTEVELPVLLDSNGARFVDIRKLQPR